GVVGLDGGEVQVRGAGDQVPQLALDGGVDGEVIEDRRGGIQLPGDTQLQLVVGVDEVRAAAVHQVEGADVVHHRVRHLRHAFRRDEEWDHAHVSNALTADGPAEAVARAGQARIRRR